MYYCAYVLFIAQGFGIFAKTVEKVESKFLFVIPTMEASWRKILLPFLRREFIFYRNYPFWEKQRMEIWTSLIYPF